MAISLVLVSTKNTRAMMAMMKRTTLLVLLAAVVTANVKSVIDDEHLYNNEVFPRNSKYGRLLEALFIDHQQEIESRQAYEPFNQQNGKGLFSTNPFPAFFNRLAIGIRNPEFTTPLTTTYDSCKAPNGESGQCLKAAVCSLVGGGVSGSCGLGTVCCINAISRCANTVTLNNTYWRTPLAGIAPQSTCSITVRLDQQNLPEQKKEPVCQVRLDFISFTIAQPEDTTVCATDRFQVSGTTIGSVPTICGDNDDQHMYISVPSSAQTSSNVQLTFTLGPGQGPRIWNIKITMIPCGATYAAPPDCLQYFTGECGTVKSFNWIDTPVAAVRQLSNQDYGICFRNELISDQRANSLCLQVCNVNNGGIPFRLSAGANIARTLNCGYDYLSIFNGRNTSPTTPTFADRFCGGRLNPADGATVNAQVCTSARPFRIHFRTNGAEVTAAVDPLTGETGGVNSGFCLSYMQFRE